MQNYDYYVEYVQPMDEHTITAPNFSLLDKVKWHADRKMISVFNNNLANYSEIDIVVADYMSPSERRVIVSYLF